MNPELFMFITDTNITENEFSNPIYINDDNMVLPLTNIMLNSFYLYIIELASFIYQLILVLIHIFIFIIKEARITININLSFIEQILLCLCLCNLIILYLFNRNKVNKNKEIKEKIEKLEQDIKFIKKTIFIRNSCEYIWSDEIKNLHADQINLIKEFENDLIFYTEK